MENGKSYATGRRTLYSDAKGYNCAPTILIKNLRAHRTDTPVRHKAGGSFVGQESRNDRREYLYYLTRPLDLRDRATCFTQLSYLE